VEGQPPERAARGAAAVILVLVGAGAALALHSPPRPPGSPEPAQPGDARARALLEQLLIEAEPSVKLLRGLEVHEAERRTGS